jgi:O-antigen ligase
VPLTAILFLIGFALGCFYAFTRHPIYGLLTYVGTIYVEPTGQWWGQGGFQSIRWVFVAAGVTLMAMLLRKRETSSPQLLRSGLLWGMLVFIAWITIQQVWALDPAEQGQLISTWLKFLVVVIMICKCVDSEKHLRWFLLTHVAGCFYLGYIATTGYTGGRFEGFGASGLAEANAGALMLVTGLVIAAALVLTEKPWVKAILGLMMVIIVNGVVTTVSRSGFLACIAAGVIFNLLTPKRFRSKVRLVSVMGVVLFVMLTNPNYWARMDTIKYQGADVVGVDTGGGRLEIIQAQLQIFKAHPAGCGHMCTSVLSPQFIAQRFLSGGYQRASHNTFMSMLVDHGIPGAVLYVAMVLWTFSNLVKLVHKLHNSESFLAMVLPGVAGVLAATTVGDLFVQYTTLEVRVWFMSIIVVLLHLTRTASAPATPRVATPVGLRVAIPQPQRDRH